MNKRTFALALVLSSFIIAAAGCSSNSHSSDPMILPDGGATLSDGGATLSDGGATAVPPTRRLDPQAIVALAECRQEMAAQAHYCLALLEGANNRLAYIGLDNGQICMGPTVDGDDYPVSLGGSLGWADNDAYVCDLQRGLERISLVDGAVYEGGIPCAAVTTDEAGRLILLATITDPTMSDGFDSVWRYASFADIVDGRGAEAFTISHSASRLTVRDGTVYFAGRSTAVLEVAPLADHAAVSELPLEGYDGWVMGMDVTDDGLLVIAGWFSDEKIFFFDAQTGRRIGDLAIAFEDGAWIVGLKCVTGDVQ